VEHGLRLLIRKGLVAKNYTKAGIYFSTNRHAGKVLEYMTSEYARRCAEISEWIAGRFQPMSDDELREFIHDNLGRWGAEFTHESLLWEEME